MPFSSVIIDMSSRINKLFSSGKSERIISSESS